MDFVGECIDTNAMSCLGRLPVRGLCSGASHIQCCQTKGVPKTTLAPDACKYGQAGKCIDTSKFNCDGAQVRPPGDSLFSYHMSVYMR